ncbi:MAG: VCBS repeat-containing protein [Candidatus Hydrogenedentes bacterium]|nr:VCBS repeat-containing protein [Candidatus Hydrogenedentota bacterium]
MLCAGINADGEVLLSEDFANGLPATWTVVDGSSDGHTWNADNPAQRETLFNMIAPFMIADSDFAGTERTLDEQLITPSIDCSQAPAVYLAFAVYANLISDSVTVEVSAGDGPWTTLWEAAQTVFGPANLVLDATAQAAGQADVQFRFYYHQSTYQWYVMIDNVWVYTDPSSGPPVLQVTPEQAPDIVGLPGGPFEPASFAFDLSNAGGGTLDWTGSADSDWLTMEPMTGSGPATVNVSVNESANILTAGDYYAWVTFSSNGGVQNRRVHLRVLAPLEAQPADLEFEGPPGGPFLPDNVEFSVTDHTQQNLAWSVESDADWLAISPTTGQGNGTITATLNEYANSLSDGDYYASITFTTAMGGVSYSVRVNVRLWVRPDLEIFPESSLEFSGPPGGPFTATLAYDFIVTYRGPGAFEWSASSQEDWLTLSPIADENLGIVKVSVNESAANLPAGRYPARVTFATTAGTFTREVVLDILVPSELRVGSVTAPPGAVARIQLYLYRPRGEGSLPGAPVGVIGQVAYDPAVLSFRSAEPSTLLQSWYGGILFAIPALAEPGIVDLTAGSESGALLTTYDDQSEDGNPGYQTSPFPLGYLVFDVIGSAGEFTTIGFDSLEGFPFGSVLITGQDGMFTVSASGSEERSPVLSITPQTSLEASGPEGGPFTPDRLQFTVSNTGGGALEWSVTSEWDWVTVTPGMGHDDGIVTVALNGNAGGLSRGRVHRCTVVFSSNGGVESREVTLRIEDALGSAPSQWQQVYDGTIGGFYTSGLYSGGNTLASPAFADIDADGDQDLFIGDFDGRVHFYRNTGTRERPLWAAPEKNFAGVATSWMAAPAFCDLDGDEDLDLTVQDGDWSLSFIENIGTLSNPQWAAPDTSFYPSLTGPKSFFSGVAFCDVDGDGDYDLFALRAGFGSRSDVPIAYFENIGTPTSPSWAEPTESPLTGNGVAFADFDGDGDFDAYTGPSLDVAGSGGDVALNYYENTGTPEQPVWIRTSLAVDSVLSGDILGYPATCDIDGDGDFDMFIGLGEGPIAFFENVGSATARQWFKVTGSSVGFDLGVSSLPVPCDLDADGDLDIVVLVEEGAFSEEDRDSFYLLRNIGTPSAPVWAVPELFAFADYTAFSGLTVQLIDFDGDSDLDAFLGTTYIENIGTGTHAAWAPPQENFLPGDATIHTLVDIDADGDVDLYTSDYSGDLLYYENTGTSGAPAWAEPIPTVLNTELVGPFTFVDLDLDGDQDLCMSRETSYPTSKSSLRVFENIGTPQQPAWGPPIEDYAGIQFQGIFTGAAPAFCDLDGDGDPDLLVGQAGGGLQFWRNEQPKLAVSPNRLTLASGQDRILDVQGQHGTLQWRLLQNVSDGTINTGTGAYTAGPQSGGIDVVEVRDAASGLFGRVHINVISPEQVSSAGKAIIVAGRRSGSDYLWAATNYLSRYAYTTCLFKGMSKENVTFLSPVVAQDVDGNGAQDDIDLVSSSANLRAAIQGLDPNTPNLTVYLVDHGQSLSGEGQFVLGPGDILFASQLGEWLNAFQTNSDCRVTVIIDYCYAGSFLPYLIPPQAKTRVAVSATGAGELAYFLGGGLISFSASFWDAIASGSSVGQAFNLASTAMNTYQHPELDDTADGIYDKDVDGAIAVEMHIGLSYLAGADRPQVGNVVGNQVITSGSSAGLWVSNVSSTYAIEQPDGVYAHIVPPDFAPDPSIPDPVADLPKVVLQLNPDTQQYEGAYDEFVKSGSYKVLFYARDIWGNVSLPKQVFVNQRSVKERAVLVVSGLPYNSAQPWETSDYLGKRVYQTFESRWLTDNEIVYLTGASPDIDGDGVDEVDGAPTLANLEQALSSLGKAGGEDKLTLYLIGPGDGSGFHVNNSETLTGDILDGWLDALQQATGADAYIVVEASNGEGLFRTPPPGMTRVQIASAAAGQTSPCLLAGRLSFTNLFLNQVFSGRSLSSSFRRVRPVRRYLFGDAATPVLEDSGDGIANQRNDGQIAKTAYIGAQFLTGGGELPVIGSVSEALTLTPNAAFLLWAGDIIDSDGIAEVKAAIVSGTQELGEYPLVYNPETARYEVEPPGLPEGIYVASISARDRSGEVSDFAFVTILSGNVRDTTPPAAFAQYPLPGDEGVPPRPRIAVMVGDSGVGVDIATLRLFVNEVEVTVLSTVEGLPREYLLSYLPAAPFGSGQPLNVSVHASDLAGNAMVPLAYTFWITDGLDTDYDGLPDDWAAYFGIVDPDDDEDQDGRSNRQEVQLGTDPTLPDAPLDGADNYEPDNTLAEAKWIGVDGARQTHNFHAADDEDWVYFYAATGQEISIRTFNLGIDCDTIIGMYRADGSLIYEDDNSGDVEDDEADDRTSYYILDVGETGLYYVRARNLLVPTTFADTAYELQVYREVGPGIPATVQGQVVRTHTGAAIAGAEVHLTGLTAEYYYLDIPVWTDLAGIFLFTSLDPGNYSVQASAPPAYPTSESAPAFVSEGQVLQIYPALALQPVPGDVNGTGGSDAVDVQLVINAALGLDNQPGRDANCDERVDAVDIQLVINAALGLPVDAC